MQYKDKYEIRQIFINLTNTRGLLWTDTVEGILFDKNGFPRNKSEKVEIDNTSLVTKVKLTKTDEVVNYILIIDYLVDYLKIKYTLTDMEITVLLKEFMIDSNTINFEKLKGIVGNWVIPTSLVIKQNENIFKYMITDIIIWKINRKIELLNKEYMYIKKLMVNRYEMIHSYIENSDEKYIRKLLSFNEDSVNDLWKEFLIDIKRKLEEKKNSPTSS